MEKIWDTLYLEAKKVQKFRQISDYVTCGEVSAAILTANGNIYTGVCVDTACSLGQCAERNAIFTMLTHGEEKITKLLAILPNGSVGAPCGACRELICQLDPKGYKDIEILVDYQKGIVKKLGELTPDWWI